MTQRADRSAPGGANNSRPLGYDCCCCCPLKAAAAATTSSTASFSASPQRCRGPRLSQSRASTSVQSMSISDQQCCCSCCRARKQQPQQQQKQELLLKDTVDDLEDDAKTPTADTSCLHEIGKIAPPSNGNTGSVLNDSKNTAVETEEDANAAGESYIILPSITVNTSKDNDC